jgi:hypothetical protein
MQSPEQAGYLNLKALAAYASCSVRWLRARLVDQVHPLPHFRVQGKLLVKLEEFDRWMAAHRSMTQATELDQLVDDVVASVCARTSP